MSQSSTRRDDQEDDFDAVEEEKWALMLRNGYSEEEVAAARKRKRCKDEVWLCSYMLKNQVYLTDPSCNFVDCHLRLAVALDGMNRRTDAIAGLRAAREQEPGQYELTLALAKLLFRSDEKRASLALCYEIIEQWREAEKSDSPVEPSSPDNESRNINCDVEVCWGKGEVADVARKEARNATHMDPSVAVTAFYLAGWIRIHDDDHSGAYRVWSEGAQSMENLKRKLVRDVKDSTAAGTDADAQIGTGEGSTCSAVAWGSNAAVLFRQWEKRRIWDAPEPDAHEWAMVRGLVGACPRKAVASTATTADSGDALAHSGTVVAYDAVEDFDSFKPAQRDPALTPALSIFAPHTQCDRVVFRSRMPVLTGEECAAVMRAVNAHHEEKFGGQWGTVRKSSVHTTDVAVEDIPILRVWLRALMSGYLQPMLASAFPQLADGTRMMEPGSRSKCRLRMHDAFIVRYDATDRYVETRTADGGVERKLVPKSLSLPEHCDTSAVSVVLPLSPSDEYTGGGTWFEALESSEGVVDAEAGHVVAFAGPLKHAGYPITAGVRNILVLFLYVEDYHYGPLLTAACQQCCKATATAVGADDVNAQAEQEASSAANAMAALKATATPSSAGSGVHTSEIESRADSVRPSGDRPGGFVVYRQTVDLVSMLDIEVAQ